MTSLDEITLGSLMQREPERWGNRGDPHLWKRVAERLAHEPLPDREYGVRRLVEKAILAEVGIDIDHSDERVYVADLSTGSGQGDGQVYVPFWRDTAIPIIVDRWAAMLTAHGVSTRA
jgi:hypothetical protein